MLLETATTSSMFSFCSLPMMHPPSTAGVQTANVSLPSLS
jgi:hypothetical protein